MITSLTHRRALRGLIAGAGGALAALAIIAPAAGAQARTLHYFSLSGPTRFTNAAGHTIKLNPPMTLPSAGDRLDETDLDFVGTAKHHAKRATASDHIACTFTGSSSATCNAQVAIGGSMLLANNFTFLFTPSPKTVIKINEGTGAYRHDHGLLTLVDVAKSNNANLTLKIS
jgi:hypothetical protein